jgi:ribonuclease Y
MLQTILIVLTVAAAIAAILVVRRTARRLLSRARRRVGEIESDAENQARIRLKEVELEAEERNAAAETQFENQTRKKRQDLQQLEGRLREQERNLQRRLQLLGQKEQEIQARDASLTDRESAMARMEEETRNLLQARRQNLEKTAGITAVQARRELVREMEGEARREAGQLLRRIEDEAREEAAGRGRRLVAEAIQKLPTGEICDNVVSVVTLPNDDMKGRIIGREGRNIRAIEMATGVDLIVDETPQAIVLSSYDPLRRAIAVTALERLIEDGRIHPARIEEVVTRARQETEEGLEILGEAAAFDLGITGLPSRLTRMLGKLKYRVVCGYNLLDHSKAVGRLAQQMANLIGARGDIALRAGLLHEIGQVDEGERQAAHPILVSADLAMKFGESAPVVEAIRSLHDGSPDSTVEAILLEAAERAIIARPGERDDNLDIFIERMENLESIASSFSGVHRAYAMRAGKEIRVIAETTVADDHEIVWLSKDITRRIESEVVYPGAIRVSVIRETRAIDYAT